MCVDLLLSPCLGASCRLSRPIVGRWTRRTRRRRSRSLRRLADPHSSRSGNDVPCSEEHWCAVFDVCVDADAVVSAFADDFYFKGICGPCAVRTDTASMYSYAEALFGIELQMERTTDL